MICSRTKPFADWLDVTYRPEDFADEDHPISEIRRFLDSQLCPVLYADAEQTRIRVGAGVVAISFKRQCWRVSFSGAALHFLRVSGELEMCLSVLALSPHKVTRLDVAVDLATDAPGFLRALEARYPDDRINLQRKAIKVTRFYSARDSDGQQTGTWYAGHRSSARVTARVYDKQAEALDKRGETLPPTTRIELTFRKDHGCTLRDVAMPASLFYQYASPALLSAPPGLPEWVSHASGWESPQKAPPLDFEVFCRRVETSPELARLIELANEIGPQGRAMLIRRFTAAVEAGTRNTPLAGAAAAR